MRNFHLKGVSAAALLAFACSQNQANRITGPAQMAGQDLIPAGSFSNSQSPSSPTGGPLNGAAGDMPAYYDSTLFTINFTELPTNGEKQVLAHNQSFNTIWTSEAELPGGKPFISVLDAIQGDGFNPLWREVEVAFNPGFTPRQLFSDNEVLAAAGGDHPEISLTFTDEIYRCSVVGSK